MHMPKAERSRPTRKAEQSRETQDRLIKVAKELFTSKGYAGTAMEDRMAVEARMATDTRTSGSVGRGLSVH